LFKSRNQSNYLLFHDQKFPGEIAPDVAAENFKQKENAPKQKDHDIFFTRNYNRASFQP